MQILRKLILRSDYGPHKIVGAAATYSSPFSYLGYRKGGRAAGVIHTFLRHEF